MAIGTQRYRSSLVFLFSLLVINLCIIKPFHDFLAMCRTCYFDFALFHSAFIHTFYDYFIEPKCLCTKYLLFLLVFLILSILSNFFIFRLIKLLSCFYLYSKSLLIVFMFLCPQWDFFSFSIAFMLPFSFSGPAGKVVVLFYLWC